MRRRRGDSAPIMCAASRIARGVAARTHVAAAALRPRALPRVRPLSRKHRPRAHAVGWARAAAVPPHRGIGGAPVPTYAALQTPIPTCPCGCAGACECECECAVGRSALSNERSRLPTSASGFCSPPPTFAPASALICAQMGCGASLPATAPRLAPRACVCGSVYVCLCVCAHT
jgi:hypothetical protein